MVKDNKISVIIPMYNAADTIERCLSSVLRQVAKDANADDDNYKIAEDAIEQSHNSQNFSVEIIVVDDGSTDEGSQIVEPMQEEFESRGFELILISQQNTGPSSARNAGLQKASGEWIYFLDSDDEIVDGCFAQLMQVARDFCAEQKCLPDLIVPRAVAILEDENSNAINADRQFPRPPTFLIDKLDIGKFVAETIQDEDWKYRFPLFYSSGKLIRAEVLKSSSVVYDESVSHAEDAKFSAELLPFVKSIVVIDQPLYKYYVGKNSLSKGRRDAAEASKAGLDFEKSVISTLRGWGVYGDIPEINNHAIKLTEIALIDYIRQVEIDYAEVRANFRQLFNDADFQKVAAQSCPMSSADKLIKRVILHKNVGLCIAFIKLCRNTGLLRS